MRAEYDFSDGVRGKYYKALQAGHTITIHKADGTTIVKEVMPKKRSPKAKESLIRNVCKDDYLKTKSFRRFSIASSVNVTNEDLTLLFLHSWNSAPQRTVIHLCNSNGSPSKDV